MIVRAIATIALLMLAGCSDPPGGDTSSPPTGSPSGADKGYHGIGQGPVRLDVYPEDRDGSGWAFCLCGEIDLAAPEARVAVSGDTSFVDDAIERLVSYDTAPAYVEEWFAAHWPSSDGQITVVFGYDDPEGRYSLHAARTVTMHVDGDQIQVHVHRGTEANDPDARVYAFSKA